MTLPEIENHLRCSPRIKAPPTLLADLQREIVVPRVATRSVGLPLWKRWFPALSLGLLLFGCLIALGIQTQQLFNLRHENARLLQTVQATPPNVQPSESISAEEAREIEALRAEVEQLRHEAQGLADLRLEHEQLRLALKAAEAERAAEDPFATHKAKAESIGCINNLKQIGLAARLWANGNGSILPPDFRTIQKELNSPKLLICPGDSGRLPAPSTWEQLNWTQVSYEYLGVGASERDPSIVLSRCSIHGNIGLVDGSAIMNHGTNLNLRVEDGRLKLPRSRP